MSARPRISALEWALVAALFLSTFAAILVTANDYGPTYDEPHYASAGIRYAEWWARVFRADRSAFDKVEIDAVWSLNHEHPPLQKCSSGFAQRWLGDALPGLAAMRLPSALWFALTVCAIYLFARGVWGRRGALFGALAFAVLPRIVAHAHFVALDMPVACWFFITVALTAQALRRNSWAWAVLAGLAFGFALMSKLNAFFLPILLLPWGLAYYRRRWAKPVVALVLIGPAVFWIGWPWLWVDVLPHLKAYLAFHTGHAAYNVWYLGGLYQYAPWHYPFVMTAVTTPLLVLVVSLIGAGRAWPRRRANPEATLLLLGLAIALIPSALPTSPKYNGIRLFLPAFPFLAALAGGGFAWVQVRAVRLLRAEGPRKTWLSALLAAALGTILLLPGLSGLARTHPYQLAYYNSLVGGPKGAAARGFETIYWGQVFQEAPPFLNGLEAPYPRLLLIPKGVIYLLEFQQQAGALRPDVQFTAEETEAAAADCVMFQAMQSDYTDLCWSLVKEAEPVFEVTVEEAPVLLAYDRRAVSAVLSGKPR
ncbi:MAG TPA: glycosyltransferase family 39 protein [Armatimonadota bacterium]|nr:glycosyltransferase family 39 protein [Armatimonadota bacterium]